MSIISREKRALLWPRATISKDCSSGTPAFSIVASWRVKNVMSFSVTFLPPRNVCRLILVMRMPWRRRLVGDDRLGRGLDLAADLPVVAVDAFPDEGVLLDGRVACFCWRWWWRWPWGPCASPVRGPGSLFVGDRLDFLERGDAGLDLEQPGLAQVAHALAAAPGRRCRSRVPLRMISWRISSVIGITW